MSSLRKNERADDTMTEQIKVRLTTAQLDQLKEIAKVRGVYASSVARQAIDKYLSTIYNHTVDKESTS